MTDFSALRREMVEHQMAARGIEDEAVLDAVREVPRERFVPADMVEFAYRDSPLPIAAGQTISQPYIVALMTAMLELGEDDRVLEVGTGSGYAAAVLAEISDEVYTIERHEDLAESARERLDDLGYDNVHVRHGDGTLGWPEAAPFDAIVVAAGGPSIPQSLRDQLAIGGRLVIPAGDTPRSQSLTRVRRAGGDEYEEEDLGRVRFVPLIGAAGWEDESATRPSTPPKTRPRQIPEIIQDAAEPFVDPASADLNGLMERIGDSRLVLLGEASHGTAEFYEMRAHITRELIKRKGFNIVAVEADWPDAAQIDRFVRGADVARVEDAKPFSRFPTWMWANTSVLDFITWLRQYNERFDVSDDAVGFYGLDLYSLNASMSAVVDYLDNVDPEAARVARERYGCLTPWTQDPAVYGAAALSGQYEECEDEVVAALQDLLKKRIEYTARDGQRFLDAVQNASLVTNAERYYRTMYYGSQQSWNLRDDHMFQTLRSILGFRGPNAKAVVWEHNSHVGDASATEMSARGQHNVGQLTREAFGDDAYLVGFGTDHGTVAAASEWEGPMEVKQVRPSHMDSYERLCHEARPDNFLLHLRDPDDKAVRQRLMAERLERAIGVIYRPETELQSHYFAATLPRQFDEYIWLDETRAVEPLTPEAAEGMPDTYPFGV